MFFYFDSLCVDIDPIEGGVKSLVFPIPAGFVVRFFESTHFCAHEMAEMQS